MAIHDEIITKLSAPFPVEQIEWRVGATDASKTKGIALAYLTSRMVMDRLDEVVGPFNWQVSHDMGDGGKVTAHISIMDPETGHWVSKSDGAGATDVEGDKGSFSDSTKRAAVNWGIGRYLYAIESPWVAISPAGKSYRIADHEYERLYKLLPGPSMTGASGVTVQEPTGLSKEPSAFWHGSSFNLLPKLPKSLLDAHGDPLWEDASVIPKLTEILLKALDKAPSRTHLARLQADNGKWITSRMTPEQKEAIADAFVNRAKQFDQTQKEKAA